MISVLQLRWIGRSGTLHRGAGPSGAASARRVAVSESGPARRQMQVYGARRIVDVMERVLRREQGYKGVLRMRHECNEAEREGITWSPDGQVAARTT